MFGSALLGLMMIPLVWGQPYPIPPTCYSKVLAMGREITQRAAEIKRDHDTNACVMSTMSSYLSLLNGLRERRCGYTRKVQALRATISQLYMIASQRCHGVGLTRLTIPSPLPLATY
ncbi:hypothetical protein AOLI_G00210510 [Acnodon oligacanthus]